MTDNNLILETEVGSIVIETYPDKAPKHVEQITRLAEDGFYDGLNFHRVIDGFMAQGGCPNGTGMGGADDNIPAEFNDVSHQEGICSMARAQDPNSASSQFFICLDDASFLDGQYTVWGKVIEGIEHVHAINKGEPPANPTKILKFRKAA
ncbi:MAG: peptidylprolyl isomerase [Aquisalinus sp.]|nr:peptidylprolyl isomerase [Aquisalinus sp.]